MLYVFVYIHMEVGLFYNGVTSCCFCEGPAVCFYTMNVVTNGSTFKNVSGPQSAAHCFWKQEFMLCICHLRNHSHGHLWMNMLPAGRVRKIITILVKSQMFLQNSIGKKTSNQW